MKKKISSNTRKEIAQAASRQSYPRYTLAEQCGYSASTIYKYLEHPDDTSDRVVCAVARAIGLDSILYD